MHALRAASPQPVSRSIDLSGLADASPDQICDALRAGLRQLRATDSAEPRVVVVDISELPLLTDVSFVQNMCETLAEHTECLANVSRLRVRSRPGLQAMAVHFALRMMALPMPADVEEV